MPIWTDAVLALAIMQAPPPDAAPSDASAVQAPNVRFVIDGVVPPVQDLNPASMRIDEVGDANGAPDITFLALDAEPEWLYISLGFAKPVNLQGLDKPLRILIDVDGSPSTGARGGPMPGADLMVIWSPIGPRDGDRGGRRNATWGGSGVGVWAVNPDGSRGEQIPKESLGFVMAPTHAARAFEMRLNRGGGRFEELTTRVYAYIPVVESENQTLEEVAPVQTLLPPVRGQPFPSATAAAAQRQDGTALRVVSWNAERGSLFSNANPFAATLRALAPDIVLWQELGADATATSLAAWMNEHVPSTTAPWTAVVSGGDLRTGATARSPLRTAPFLDGLKRSTPDGDRLVRVAGAIVQIPNGPDDAGAPREILAVSTHLKCCGHIGTSEDETRFAEGAAIRDAIRSASEKLSLEGIVVGGDMNLVGDRAVLDRLAQGADLDGSDLDVCDPMQLDSRTNATWRDVGQAFLPGRLDWILVSGSRLNSRSFVFSVEDLAPAAASELGLPASALPPNQPSDHLPVVADLSVRSPSPRATSTAPAPRAP